MRFKLTTKERQGAMKEQLMRKFFVFIMSAMLILTGIAPSFAYEANVQSNKTNSGEVSRQKRNAKPREQSADKKAGSFLSKDIQNADVKENSGGEPAAERGDKNSRTDSHASAKEDPSKAKGKVPHQDMVRSKITRRNKAAAATPEKYFEFSKKTGTITEYYFEEGPKDVIIPKSIGGVKVLAIGTGAFSGCDSITSVKMPDSITKIREGAFEDCSSLRTVKISKNVVSIGNDAFSGCSLKSITIPEGIKSIGDKAFSDCNFKRVTIPKGLNKISSEMFSGTRLINIDIPGNIKTIENSAFDDCDSLLKVTLRNGVKTIGEGAFADCNILKRVFIPGSVTDINKDAFLESSPALISVDQERATSPIAEYEPWGAKSGTQVVFKGESPTERELFTIDTEGTIREYHERNNPTPEKVSIPKKIGDVEVNALGRALFAGSKVKSLSIPDSVTYIGEKAFKCCAGLSSVTIPDSVTYMGSEAFSECENLKDVKLSSNLTEIEEQVFSNSSLKNGIKIPSSVTIIDDSAFQGCKFNSITIPDSVKSLDDAFSDCKSLKTVRLGSRLEYAGNALFEECPSLRLVYIDQTKAGCKFKENIKDWKLPGNCKIIYRDTAPQSRYLFNKTSGKIIRYYEDFKGNKPETVKIPKEIETKAVSSVGYKAFNNCDIIKSLTVPEGVKRIEAQAISDCDKLSSLKLPNSLTYIGEGALSGNKALKNIVISKGVSKLEGDAFAGSSALKLIYVDRDKNSCSFSSGEPWGALSDCKVIYRSDDIIPLSEVQSIASVFPMANYSKVTLKGGDNAAVDGENTYLVKKDHDVDLSETVKDKLNVNTGYTFHKWDKPVKAKFDQDTVLTAVCLKDDDINGIDDNDNPPDGFVKMTFEKGDHGSLTGNKAFAVKKGEYWDFSDKAPAVTADSGYSFFRWNKALKGRFNEDTVRNAEYLQDDIINSIDSDVAVPSDFVKIIFKGGEHGTLTGNSAFAVKKGNTWDLSGSIPHVKENSGYTFYKWDKPTKGKFDNDVEITAKYLKNDVMNSVDSGDEIPDSFVKVTFKKGDHGTLTGDVTFAVKKEKECDLADKAPAVTADSGYTFYKWDKPLKTKLQENTTVTALYLKNDAINVIADTEDLPSDFVKIKFAKGEHGTLTGDSVFAVKKGEYRDLSGKAPAIDPDSGYTFQCWDKALDGSFDKDTVITAKYLDNNAVNKIDPADILPGAFVRITFAEGKYGTLSGDKTFAIRKDKEYDLADKAPSVNAESGYTFHKWDKALNGKFEDDTKITAEYLDDNSINPVKKSDNVPDSFVKVAFSGGAHGKLTEDKAFAIKKGADWNLSWSAPGVIADSGYIFIGWNRELKGKFDNDATLTAKYLDQNSINAIDINDRIPAEFVKVTFYEGAHGVLAGDNVFAVSKGKIWNFKDKAPSVQPESGYTFHKWDQILSGKFDSDVKITAKYLSNNSVNTIDKTDSVPDGFAKVVFKAGAHGSFTDPATFAVKKGADCDLSSKAPEIKAESGYTFRKWDKAIKGKFTDDTNITATYLDNNAINIIEPAESVPGGFAKLVFEPTSEGRFGSDELGVKRVYAVSTNMKWHDIKKAVPKSVKYKSVAGRFSGWSPELPGDDEKAVSETYTAQYAGVDIVPVDSMHLVPPMPDYVKVTFITAGHGKPQDTSEYWVTGFKKVDLTTYAPGIKVDPEWKFTGWDKPLNDRFTVNTEITAEYAEDRYVIKANPGEATPADRVKVIFNKGDHGTLDGHLEYFVKKDVDVNLGKHAPLVKADPEWKFTSWDKSVKAKFTDDTELTALYAEDRNIIPANPGDKIPEGRFKVTFTVGNWGTLSGHAAYFVKKNVMLDLAPYAPEVTIKGNTNDRFTGWSDNNKAKVAKYKKGDKIIIRDDKNTTLYAIRLTEELHVDNATISTVGKIKKKAMLVSWKSSKYARKYEVQYKMIGKKKKWIKIKRRKGDKKSERTISGLPKNSKFMFRVRGVNGKTKSGWSTAYRYIMSTRIQKLKAGKGTITIKSPEMKGIKKYHIQYGLTPNKENVKAIDIAKKKGKIVLKGLEKGKKYYVRIAPIHEKYIGILSGYMLSGKVK